MDAIREYNRQVGAALAALTEDDLCDRPDPETLEEWVWQGTWEATDGCRVEYDGLCPHGKPSWGLVMEAKGMEWWS